MRVNRCLAGRLIICGDTFRFGPLNWYLNVVNRFYTSILLVVFRTLICSKTLLTARRLKL